MAVLDASASERSDRGQRPGEIVGESPDGLSFHALMQGGPGALTSEGDQIHRGKSSKFVLRVTGDGDLGVVARGPGGQVVEPDWGPEQHEGSSWDRPGDEWGVGFSFPAAGCWTVVATREGRSAHFGVGVV